MDFVLVYGWMILVTFFPYWFPVVAGIACASVLAVYASRKYKARKFRPPS